MGSLFLLESKGKCLFCREKVNSKPTASEADNSSNPHSTEESFRDENDEDYQEEKFSLRHICHYLKENLKHKVLIFREGEKTTSYNRSKGFQITLCKKCSVVVKRLTNLCQELELIQIKVDHAVKEMIQIISTTPPQSSSGGNAGGNVSFDSLLREKTRKLSISALQKSRHPRIKLFKLKVDEEEENPDWELPSQSLSICFEEPPEEDPKLEQTIEREFEKAKNLCYPSSSSFSGGLCNDSAESNDIQCPFCSCRLLDSNRLRFHTLTIHPEQFFYSVKLEGTLEEEFRSACLQLLAQETKARVPNGFYQCRHCLTSKKERRRIIQHLVDFHYDTLVEELIMFQRSGKWHMKEVETAQIREGTLIGAQSHSERIIGRNEQIKIHPIISEIIQNISKNTVEKDGRVVLVCRLCPLGFASTSLGLERHVLSRHPEHFLAAFRTPNTTPELFKTNCEYILENLKKAAVKPGGVQFCPYCESNYTDPRALQRHLIKIHYNILGKMLTENSMTEELVQHSVKTSLDQARKENGPKCPHCNFKFSCRASLNRHLKISCEKLKKIGALHSSTSKHVNFDDKTLKCKLCSITFPSIFNLSHHMKLKHSQHHHNVGNLKFRPTCRHCGMDFSCRPNLMRHMKRYCVKIKASGLLPDQNVMDSNEPSILASLLHNDGDVEFETSEHDRVPNVADNDVQFEEEMDVKEEPVIVREESDYTNTNPFSLLSSMNMGQVETVNFYNESNNGNELFFEENGEGDNQMSFVEDNDPLQM